MTTRREEDYKGFIGNRWLGWLWGKDAHLPEWRRLRMKKGILVGIVVILTRGGRWWLSMYFERG